VNDVVVEVDTASAVPPFEQLRSQIVAMVASGVLATGQQLPTVRQLASDLGLAPGTVARAYKALEQEGVIETRGRHGTFVAAAKAFPRERVKSELAQAAHDFAMRARQLGVTTDIALGAVKRAL
jgi:DNA-binding transcriptional regulator YhcF (GntR family)